MYYCFLNEDIDGLVNNPLSIQKEYAQRLDALSIASLTQQDFLDPVIDLTRKKVLLRCTYDNLLDGLRFLSERGVDLVETEVDIEKIECWYKLGLTYRQLRELKLSDLLSDTFDADTEKILHSTDKVFLKSKRKGFSAVVRASRIIQHDSEVISFLETQCDQYGQHMLLARYCPLKTDSIGTRETRHFILNNQLVNSSRFLHSIKHTVPKSHKVKAQAVVDQLLKVGTFPSNYVLDLGEFIDDTGNSYLDIVELNPLSCSMCYVNNSIFEVTVPEIDEIRTQLLMGYEYCYDFIKNPQNYVLKRISNKDYSYISEERYYFL